MNKIIYSSIILFSSLLLIPGESQGKKFSFKYGKSDEIKVISSFISDSGNAASAKKRDNSVKSGEKLYFYYKVGPVQSSKGKGAPFRTKLIIKKGSGVLKDFGWQSGNVASAKQRDKNLTFKWFHTAGWNFTVSPNLAAGSYTAEIYHNDINSNMTLKISFPFTCNGSKSSADSSGISVADFIDAVKKNDRNRIEKYISGQVFDISKNKNISGSTVLKKLYESAKYISSGNTPVGISKDSASSVMIYEPPVFYYYYFKKGSAGSLYIWKFKEHIPKEARQPGL